jgi:carotenoid cleavage dioxygenase-like enzyme
VLSGKPYIENYHWQGHRATRLLVIEKSSGNIVGVFEDQACFIFHHVNAFEEKDEIVLDTIAYEDATIVSNLYLDKLLDCSKSIAGGRLRRFRLNTKTKNAASEIMSPEILELPGLNNTLYSGTNYQYIYGTGKLEQARFLDRLVKVDLISNKTLFWQEPHFYPGEPVFINNPLSQEEDAGCLLSVVLDGLSKHSLLLVLDAQTMEELARITIPQVIPFGFHGIFIE